MQVPSLARILLDKTPLCVLRRACREHLIDEFTLHSQAASVIQRAWRHTSMCLAIQRGRTSRSSTAWDVVATAVDGMTSYDFMQTYGRPFARLIEALLDCEHRKPQDRDNDKDLYRMFAVIVMVAFNGDYPHRAHERLTRRYTRFFLTQAFRSVAYLSHPLRPNEAHVRFDMYWPSLQDLEPITYAHFRLYITLRQLMFPTDYVTKSTLSKKVIVNTDDWTLIYRGLFFYWSSEPQN